MKKLFYLLFYLIPFVSFAQISTGQEAEFDYGIRNLAPQTVDNPNYLGTLGSDGTMGQIGVNDFLNGRAAQADTGVLDFGGLTTNSATTINIGFVDGYVVNNESVPGLSSFTHVSYAGATGVTVTTVGSGIASYVMLSSAGVISFQNTFPTSTERKAKIWLGKVSHPGGSITLVVNEPDYITSPLSFSRDWAQDLGPYVNNGVYPYANGANLNINITGGTITGDGINFVTNKTDPNHLTMGAAIVANFTYRTQTGAGGATTAVTPAVYDLAGTVTAIPGSTNQATIQYFYVLPGIGYVAQLGQTIYPTFSAAVAALGKETFVRYPSFVGNVLPVAALVVTKGCTALNDTGVTAQFFRANKNGDFFGASAGTSTATIQSAYNNSVQPVVTTNSTLGAFTFKRGSAADTDNIIVGQNGAGTNTFQVKGNGDTNISTAPTGTNTTQAASTAFVNSQLLSQTVKNIPYSYPSWWTQSKIPVSINNGAAEYDYNTDDAFNIYSYTPFYISPTGSDAANGLSELTPKATVSSCISAGAKLIYMMSGIYYRDTFITFNQNLSGNDLIIIGIGNVYVTQAQKSLVYTLGVSNTYSTARSSVDSVIDASITDTNGYFKKLKLVASQALCEAEAGTYYTNNVTVWVHNYDNRAPDTNILTNLSIGGRVLSDTGRLYLKNLKILGVEFAAKGSTSASILEIYMNNIVVPYANDVTTTANGLEFDNFKFCAMQKCTIIDPKRDGFNYHNTAGVGNSLVYELDCSAFNAGVNDINTNNQCSTAHDGLSIIRLNGNYYGGNTQVVADVNTNAKSILIGCELNTGNVQSNTYIFWGVTADLNGCKLFGSKLINSEVGGAVTVSNSFLNISGTTGSVTINL